MNIKNGIVQDKEIGGVPIERAIVQRVTGRCRPGIAMTPWHTVYHDTGNDSRGADARAHARYVQSQESGKSGRQVSYHFAVDDKRIVQIIPLNEVAWCQGDGRGNGNMHGISVEQCINRDGDRRKAEDNACKLHAALMDYFNIKLTKHQDWSGKYCPATILREGRWKKIVEKVDGYRGMQEDDMELGAPVCAVITYHPAAKKVAMELSKRISVPIIRHDTPHNYYSYGMVIGVGDEQNINQYSSYLTHFVNMQDDWSASRNEDFLRRAAEDMNVFRRTR
jgi:N-acetylmuramoyl-L-alanine amidase CwlA